MTASIESSDGDLGFQIAPMVDVVFVLMLFFMAASGAQILTKELPVQLPGHRSGEPTAVIVDIAADGSVLFNEEQLGLPNDPQLPLLRSRFQHILNQFGSKDVVMIRPSPGIQHQRVMEVLNAMQAAGIGNVTFL